MYLFLITVRQGGEILQQCKFSFSSKVTFNVNNFFPAYSSVFFVTEKFNTAFNYKTSSIYSFKRVTGGNKSQRKSNKIIKLLQK